MKHGVTTDHDGRTIIKREHQVADVIYVHDYVRSNVERAVEHHGAFVSPDGYGRLYYADEDEAREQHGDLPVAQVDVAITEWC